MKAGQSWVEHPTQLLLLGTFHFRERSDLLGERRQREIDEVVERLESFRPTTVAIERRPERQEETERDVQAYLQGAYSLRQDEIDQLGFRLAR